MHPVKMNASEDMVCRLCLKLPQNEFVLVEEVTKQLFDVLLVKMKFDVSNGPLICEDCIMIIERSLSFILRCLNAEKEILLFNTVENKISIDLRDVYAYNSKQIIFDDFYICRFCINRIGEGNLVPLNDLINENMSFYMLKEYMFQMEPNVENPVICFHCRDNIESYFKFLLMCRDTEEKIDTYKRNEGITSGEKIMFNKVFQQFFKSNLEYTGRTQIYRVKKEASIEDVTEIGITNMYNWTERIEKKFIIEDERINTLLHQNGGFSDYSCTSETKDSSFLGSQVGSYEALPVKSETLALDTNRAFETDCEESDSKGGVTLSENTHPQSNIKFGICICDKKIESCSKCNSQFEIVSRRPTLYKCKLCPFRGVWIKSHMLKHRDISDVTVYKCTACDFKTKHKVSLSKHSMIHKTETEVTMYKCTACDFKSIYKDSLKRHSVTHRDKAEINMYKCTACDFETVHKGCLTRHSLSHNPQAEFKIYKCTVCGFKTKHKISLERHLPIHNTDAELTMYKCSACDFKTKHKRSLDRHSKTHKIGAEVTYKCKTCDYKVKRKDNLKKHLLTHKTGSEVTMYKCTACDYQTMHKFYLKSHSLIHKTDTEVKMYECTVCDFKTKRKNNLRDHSLIHKTEAEVTMNKCTICDFKTKYKQSLRLHSLIHKSESEIKMYKCSSCDFKSKHRACHVRHSLTHKSKAEVTM